MIVDPGVELALRALDALERRSWRGRIVIIAIAILAVVVALMLLALLAVAIQP